MPLAVVSCSVLAALLLVRGAEPLVVNQRTVVAAASNTSSEERASPVLHLKPNPGSSALPPPYMLHLYNRYRKGRLPHSTANTVRSFLPIQGKLGNKDILVFNLTGVHATEYIERADLHLHSKRHVRASKQKARIKEGLRVKILDLSRPSMPEVERIPFSRANPGWHTLDVTDGIITCLEGDAGDHHLVGLVAETESGSAKLADIAKMSSRPFLVVFSEDDDHMAIEELERRSLDLRRKATSGSNATSVLKNRMKREILDNELPDYLVQGGETSMLEVQARMKHRPLDSDIIPYPDAPKTKPLRARHRKRRRRKERRLPLLWGRGWWKGGRHENDATVEEDDEEERRGQDNEALCQRRKLVVDFAEIGWSEWIISPNSFEAHFCAGFCPFPLTKKVQPSNHATIQSLVHVLGLHNDVPSPCCVPQTMSSVTLLYFDEDRNVVLKNYPSMTVESCACR